VIGVARAVRHQAAGERVRRIHRSTSPEYAPVDLLRTATRSAFSLLVDRAIAEPVSFVLFPGDMFDTGWRDWNTGLFFVKEMARLNDAGIAAYLLRGNYGAKKLSTNIRVSE
jgi:hypothetical protein